MKKFTATLFLAFVLVFSLFVNNTFAEGDIPIGGRTCPPNTVCVGSADGDIPIGGKNCAPDDATCEGDIPIGGRTSGEGNEDESPFLTTVLDYLAQLFG